MTEFYDEGPKWVGGVPDPVLVALGESRARYGDLEARLVEAEAVIAAAREAAQPTANGEPLRERVIATLDAYRPVVLADHDKEVAARAWDEGFENGDEQAYFDLRGLPTDSDAHTFPRTNPYRSGGTP